MCIIRVCALAIRVVLGLHFLAVLAVARRKLEA